MLVVESSSRYLQYRCQIQLHVGELVETQGSRITGSGEILRVLFDARIHSRESSGRIFLLNPICTERRGYPRFDFDFLLE